VINSRKELAPAARRGRQRDSKQNSKDTSHQRDLVKWTRNLAYTTGGLAVATFAVAGFAGWQAWEMRSGADQQHHDTLTALGKTDATIAALNGQARVMNDQLTVSQNEFTATNRPWISIDSMKISSPLVFGDNGNITLSVHFSLANSGHTPAIFVNPNLIPVLMISGHQLSKVINSTRAYCENKRIGEFSPMESGILVSPGKTVTHPFHFGITITPEDIKKGKELTGIREAILPYICGCINYQFTFGEKQRHQTGFVYELLGPNTLIYLDGGNIQINDLTLIEQDGSWAD
jgi:hypothetical protein